MGETWSALKVIIALVCFIDVMFLLIAATTEPGVIPRDQDPFESLANVPFAYKQMLLKNEAKRKFFINKKVLAKRFL